jgi:hypothetical protein
VGGKKARETVPKKSGKKNHHGREKPNAEKLGPGGTRQRTVEKLSNPGKRDTHTTRHNVTHTQGTPAGPNAKGREEKGGNGKTTKASTPQITHTITTKHTTSRNMQTTQENRPGPSQSHTHKNTHTQEHTHTRTHTTTSTHMHHMDINNTHTSTIHTSTLHTHTLTHSHTHTLTHSHTHTHADTHTHTHTHTHNHQPLRRGEPATGQPPPLYRRSGGDPPNPVEWLGGRGAAAAPEPLAAAGPRRAGSDTRLAR